MRAGGAILSHAICWNLPGLYAAGFMCAIQHPTLGGALTPDPGLEPTTSLMRVLRSNHRATATRFVMPAVAELTFQAERGLISGQNAFELPSKGVIQLQGKIGDPAIHRGEAKISPLRDHPTRLDTPAISTQPRRGDPSIE